VVQIGVGKKTNKIIDITITNFARVLYILQRKAREPSLIAPPTKRVLSFPGSCFLTHRRMYNPVVIDTTANIGVINQAFVIGI
jgi:hypothetical protein